MPVVVRLGVLVLVLVFGLDHQAPGQTPVIPPSVPATPSPSPQPPVSSASPSNPPSTGSSQPAAKSAPLSPAARKQLARDAEPTVVSAEAAAKLRPPTDAYGRSPDLRDVPAWRQARFFNVQAPGRFFVYVVDRSGSMDDFDRFERAKRELMRSVSGMQAGQSFFVIFYNEHATPMPGTVPRSASAPARSELAHWLNRVDAFGGTDPQSALSLAIGMRPDGIFLLSDGDYPPGTAARVAAMNPQRIPIHCIDLSGGAGGADLATIAGQSGGQYSGQRR